MKRKLINLDDWSADRLERLPQFKQSETVRMALKKYFEKNTLDVLMEKLKKNEEEHERILTLIQMERKNDS